MVVMQDYIEQAEKSFMQAPLNEVDAMVFAQLAYYDFDQLDKPTTFSQFTDPQLQELLTSKSHQGTQLLQAVANSRRFNPIKWCNPKIIMDRAQEIQFGAVIFQLPTGRAVIAYRGTPAITIGWKEDLNMTYRQVVPAQRLAQTYFKAWMRKHYWQSVYLVGHSKGGNLATYVTLNASTSQQKKIVATYNFDGPGFLNQEERYQSKLTALQTKIHKYVPQQALIGLLLDDRFDYQVVASKGIGPAQHLVTKWEIQDDHLVKVDDLQTVSRWSKDVIDDWLNQLSSEELQAFLSYGYQVANQANLTYFRELYALDKILSVAKSTRELSPSAFDMAKNILRKLLQSMINQRFKK